MRVGAVARAELAAAALFVGGAAAVIWDLGDAPPPLYDPIGSAALPRFVGWLVIGLSVALLIASRRRPAHDEERSGDWSRFALVGGATLAYILALTAAGADFAWSSAIYLAAAIGGLARPPLRRWPLLALVAVALGFGCDLLFTRFFYVDLP